MARKRPVPVEDRRSGTPAEQLRRDLDRFRATGLAFDAAWELAFSRTRWPHDTEQRLIWKGTIAGMRPAFRRRYESAPQSGPQAAVARLEPVAA